MSEPHAVLNAGSVEEAAQALARCCGARRWVAAMVARRPFASTADLHAAADAAWGALGRDDYLEAFAHHPAIGAPKPGDRWASQEQAGVGAETVEPLRRANATYAERFGYLFIVCATGKSAAEMLALLQARLANDAETELRIAAAEQAKITHLRLDKLAGMITSHVLDTALGRPAQNLGVRLDVLDEQAGWQALAAGVTDERGRVAGLGPAVLEARTYRLTFETGAYLAATGRPVFYPRVEVVFTVGAPAEHHHIPLLLSPFGYSTYRGS